MKGLIQLIFTIKNHSFFIIINGINMKRKKFIQTSASIGIGATILPNFTLSGLTSTEKTKIGFIDSDLDTYVTALYIIPVSKNS